MWSELRHVSDADTYSYTAGQRHTNADFSADGDADFHRSVNTDAHTVRSELRAHANPDAYCDAGSEPNTHSDSNANRNSGGKPNFDPDGNTDFASDSYSNSDGSSYTDAHTVRSQLRSNANSDTYGDAGIEPDADVDSDRDTASNCNAHSDCAANRDPNTNSVWTWLRSGRVRRQDPDVRDRFESQFTNRIAITCEFPDGRAVLKIVRT